MDIKQLRNEVQLLRDELAIMKRKYEDIIYNLDTDNFSSRFVKEQGDMRTAIEVTAEGIKTKVSNEEFESTKTQLANQITSEVKDLNDELSSEITQTADSIQTTVSSVFNEITKVSSKSKMTDKSKIYTYNGENYHYNRITKQWEKIDGNSIASSFIQTDDGFELIGNVSVKSQDENGNEVRISNGNIQFFPYDDDEESLYGVSLVDLSMYNIGGYWQPRWRFGRGSNLTYDGSGTGYIYKTTTGFGMMYNTESGETLTIEFNDGNNAINIIGNVVFSGGTVTLPDGTVGGGSGSGGEAVFGL